jgi:hypothetical protein
VIADSPAVGVAESRQPTAYSSQPKPTIVRGVLVLGEVNSTQHSAYRAELLDVSGREALNLHPGMNDVSVLPTGVYFVKERGVTRGEGGVGIRKVVVTK